MSNWRMIDFSALGDERGSLIALESHKNIPFLIRRVYYIYDTKIGVSRGFHAHRDLEQVAVCVSGECTFFLDDGHQREEILLDSPLKGLYLGSMIWREMSNFSHNCVLMVLASRHYDELDYIRNYEDFLRDIK